MCHFSLAGFKNFFIVFISQRFDYDVGVDFFEFGGSQNFLDL